MFNWRREKKKLPIFVKEYHHPFGNGRQSLEEGRQEELPLSELGPCEQQVSILWKTSISSLFVALSVGIVSRLQRLKVPQVFPSLLALCFARSLCWPLGSLGLDCRKWSECGSLQWACVVMWYPGVGQWRHQTSFSSSRGSGASWTLGGLQVNIVKERKLLKNVNLTSCLYVGRAVGSVLVWFPE